MSTKVIAQRDIKANTSRHHYHSSVKASANAPGDETLKFDSCCCERYGRLACYVVAVWKKQAETSTLAFRSQGRLAAQEAEDMDHVSNNSLEDILFLALVPCVPIVHPGHCKRYTNNTRAMSRPMRHTRGPQARPYSCF